MNRIQAFSFAHSFHYQSPTLLYICTSLSLLDKLDRIYRRIFANISIYRYIFKYIYLYSPTLSLYSSISHIQNANLISRDDHVQVESPFVRSPIKSFRRWTVHRGTFRHRWIVHLFWSNRPMGLPPLVYHSVEAFRTSLSQRTPQRPSICIWWRDRGHRYQLQLFLLMDITQFRVEIAPFEWTSRRQKVPALTLPSNKRESWTDAWLSP